ncbi:hypothetical protein GOP47_0008818 [Adiantum capillus-veneris]|uniref:Heterokaryon incompatibility domain-containing protein n=1 Tax=Adiantum capillus-veneris TaxID=13818 RepID=A0A9D4UZA2_ADICA|nr:hypothetical protein GOP47_0008818 [Adiantum capillus-veneris]
MQESSMSSSLLKSNAFGADIGEKLPIRLIDVIGTISSHHKGNIVFTEGSSRGWDFHIVSHTWSKGIRDLSEEIGEHIINDGCQLAGQRMNMEADAYSHAFKKADFSNVSSYQELRQFLRLLAGDEVKHIWFDALCIDQTNMEEKSREIGNMGPYYRRSQGCYVLTHGVGEGYQLWGKQGPRGFELPRWFSRVWTLQEFLLPRRLSFFVEALDPKFLVFVNMLARAKSKTGLCRCFCGLPQAEEYELVKSICDANDEVDLSWAVSLELRGDSMKKTDWDDDGEETESFSSEGLSKRSAKLLTESWESGSLSRNELLQLYLQLLLQDQERSQAQGKLAPSSSSFRPLLLPIPDAAPNEEANNIPASLIAKDNHKAAVDVLIPSTNYVVCTQCQSLPMIRNVQMHVDAPPNMISSTSDLAESSNERTIYLVDREAYLGVMQCDSRMSTEPSPPAGNSKGVQELRSLYARLLSSCPIWRAWDVIVEVGKRNCTVEEDRVLGILGLLGKLEGGELSQLRSGNRLQDQIRDLASVCSPEMLVELCGMDVRACATAGMSWAPDFHDSTCHDFWFTYVQSELRNGQESLSVQVKRESVTATGALKLRAKVVSAYVHPVTALPEPLQNTDFIKSFLGYNSETTHFMVINTAPFLLSSSNIPPDPYGFIPLCCTIPDDQASSTTPLIINFEFHPSYGNIYRGCMQLPITIHRSATTSIVKDLSFQIKMVLLADTHCTRSGDKLQLIMLCLKSATNKEGTEEVDQELHKIGMLSFIVDPDQDHLDVEVKRLNFESTSMNKCTIGGLGADLSAHVLHINTHSTPRPFARFCAFFKRLVKVIFSCVSILWRPNWMRHGFA